jgi:beta-lactamase class A
MLEFEHSLYTRCKSAAWIESCRRHISVDPADLSESLAQLESKSSGRLGVAVLDTGPGASGGHRIDERFAMCSTFTVLLAAAVLHRVDANQESLDRALPVPTQGCERPAIRIESPSVPKTVMAAAA